MVFYMHAGQFFSPAYVSALRDQMNVGYLAWLLFVA
jgi:hypothetical protein